MFHINLCTDVYASMRLEERGEIFNLFLVETLQGIIIWLEVLLNSRIIKIPISEY